MRTPGLHGPANKFRHGDESPVELAAEARIERCAAGFPMRVAIVHYHLDPGGVTRVIEAASRVLGTAGIGHVILVGDAGGPREAEAFPVRRITGLGYLTTPGDLTAEMLADALRSTATEALGGAPDVWHFHNHSLGKNCLLPDVVARLAEAGERLVLQIHDLAEQGRPGNYPFIADCHRLYPFSPRIHYAFLNSRDLTIFTNAGLPEGNASLLPNSISPFAPLRDFCGSAALPPPSPIVFAPIRGIRRKNLGELVFLSALAPEGTRIAISRAPKNPEALPIHETWRKFSGKHRLPIAFDVVDHFAPAVGAGTGFESWVAHASHFATTSVSEGFGLPFLEAAAHGKPLIGRNLPHLTAEHARHGIRCGRLYDRLLVPVDWIALPILRDYLIADLERTYRTYRRPLPNWMIGATLDALRHGEHLDFGNLPEALQQAAIERFAEPGNRGEPLVEIGGQTEPAEDWLARVIANRTPTATPEQLAPYSPAEYGKKLTALYSRLAAAPVADIRDLSGNEILTANLAPRSFHFLLAALKPNPAPQSYRAVIFDIYGTLLVAAPGGVKPDAAADPLLRKIIERAGHQPPESPSTELHAAVLRHHAAAGVEFPEIDLRVLWREILALEEDADTGMLVRATEAAWHPASPMPGAAGVIQRLARSGISLGLLSNAQSNTLSSLGGLEDLFAPELTILSYQHGIAKPAPALLQTLTDRLAGRGITPAETLYVGNDPQQDISPAAAAGFKTALFTGHPLSLRPGECAPDFTFKNWTEFPIP